MLFLSANGEKVNYMSKRFVEISSEMEGLRKNRCYPIICFNSHIYYYIYVYRNHGSLRQFSIHTNLTLCQFQKLNINKLLKNLAGINMNQIEETVSLEKTSEVYLLLRQKLTSMFGDNYHPIP